MPPELIMAVLMTVVALLLHRYVRWGVLRWLLTGLFMVILAVDAIWGLR